MTTPNDSEKPDTQPSLSASGSDKEKESGKAENLTDLNSVKTEKTEEIKPEQQVQSQESEQRPADEQHNDGGGQSLQFTFSFHGDIDGVRYTFAGKPGDSLLTALQFSHAFRNKEQENKFCSVPLSNKPLQGIVSSMIPCQCLPAGAHFVLSFVKGPKDSISGSSVSIVRSRDKRPILFYICPMGRTKGRDNRKIISCKKLSERESNLCVLGFEGETILEALKLDGRFITDVLSDLCYLVTFDNPVTKIQFNNTVNTLNGKVFQVQVTGAANRQVATDQSQRTTAQSSTTVDKIHSKSSKERNRSERISMGRIEDVPSYMADRNKTVISDFQKFVKNRTGDDESQSAIVNFLKSEYQTHGNISIPVKHLPMLKAKSSSVGYISNLSGTLLGTCFILKDAYILTCYHVVDGLVGKDITAQGEEAIARLLHKIVTVTFEYEQIKIQGSSYKVKQWFKVYSEVLDYAVLELMECPQRKSNPLPGLLENYSVPPQNGAVYIIGHPKGEIKKIDNCAVLPVVTEDRQIAERILKQLKNQLKSEHSLKQILNTMYLVSQDILNVQDNRDCLKYDTCFFHGSSGSPVLNSDGEVVAMHCAGVGQPQSLFEYGTTILAFGLDLLEVHGNFFQKLFQVRRQSEEPIPALAEQ